MDLIEVVIHRLAAQVRAVDESVSNNPATKKHLQDAIEQLEMAASSRHSNPPGAAEDNYEAQAAQIARAELALADPGMDASLNPQEAGATSDVVAIGLTDEERDFLMTLMIARPPAESAEEGVIVGNNGIDEIPEGDYRRLWLSIDDKFRSV